MIRAAVLMTALLFAQRAHGQADANSEVRAALEEQAPVPSVPMALPGSNPTPQADKRVAAKAEKGGRARGNLGQASQAATGQARAEEVRKNARGGKPPKPPRP